MSCVPCKVLKDCLTFPDFITSVTANQLFVSPAQNITVTCPSGTVITTSLDAGAVGFVLNFQLGEPPYPNLVLNCTGGTITVPVPDDTTQAQLVALINGMLNTCMNQIATSIGCAAGVFFNTPQIYNPCNDENPNTFVQGNTPAGVTPQNGGQDENGLMMAGGIVQSTISVGDANAKAQQVLQEIFSTTNANCQGGA
jgi:hypothetical protein